MGAAEDIAGRVELLRDLGELSQREMSDVVGVSHSHIQKIESGDRENFGVKTAELIARATGSSLDWLISGRGTPPAKRTVMRALALARGRIILDEVV